METVCNAQSFDRNTLLHKNLKNVRKMHCENLKNVRN